MSSAQFLARQVNDILGAYVRIHDAIFAFSLRKLLPIPGLFEAIDYCTHEATLRELSQRLAATISGDLSTALAKSDSESAFLKGLNDYAVALHETINRLEQMSEQLCRKSQGARNYRYDTYDVDVKAYDASVQRYVALGHRLNTLYAALL